jgi:hypothetical protein
MYIHGHVKCPLLGIFDRFSKNTQILNSIKIRPVGAELFHADRQTNGQTDMTKITVAFRNFSNSHKNNELKMSSLIRLLVIRYPSFQT